jgi:hypothetical protein
MTTPTPTVPTSRAVWIAIVLLAATIVAAVAGLLTYAGGAKVPTAILAAGGAFVGATTFLLTLLIYATGGRSA